MNYQQKIKSIVIICLCVFSGFFVYYLLNSIQNYDKAVDEANEFRDDIYIEMLTLKASDGVDINAYFYSSYENWEKDNHSVPYIIACHGMSGNPYQVKDLAYTFVKRGYSVLIPEFRGHDTNADTSYFGSKEPWDVINFINFIENQERFSSINITNGGIIGTSLGGLFATLTYIFESLGKGRLRALTSLSGPLNSSRAIQFYTTTPKALGYSEFIANLTGTEDKNPLTYINSTFPRNVFIRHGTEDEIVDFECSVDFMRILNKTGNRSDIQYQVVEGGHHDVASSSKSYREGIAWFEKYLIYNQTQPEDIELIDANFSTKFADQFMLDLQISCCLLIPIIVLLVYLIRPNLFLTLTDREIKEKVEKEALIKKDIHIKNKNLDFIKERNTNLILFVIIQLAGSLIALFLLKNDILTEMMIISVFMLIFDIYLYRSKFNLKTKLICKKSLNPKISLLWIGASAFSLIIYYIIPNIPFIEWAILNFGIRIYWYIPYFAIFMTLTYTTFSCFSKYLLSNNVEINDIRKKQIIILPLLLMISLIIFLFWDLDANLYGIPLGIAIIIGLPIGFMIIDIISQFSEHITKSNIFPSIILSFVVIFFVFSSKEILLLF